jgi:L-malate glycosyltransferase
VIDRDLRIGFVGPNVGRHIGRVTTQGEVLADHFARAGFVVRETSSALNPIWRGVEIGSDLLRWGRQVDAFIVSLYSGRSFLYADLATRLARLVRRPAVVVLHAANLPAFAQQHPHWVSRVLARAARIVAPSAYFHRWSREGGWRAVEIPNVLPAAPDSTRRLATARPRLLWLRSFDEMYDPVMAVEVLARVAHDHPDVGLTMAGQRGALRGEVEARSRQLGVGGHVRFEGFLDLAAKARELAGHDIFLHTSRVDNAPVTVLEAMAWGLVVVANPVGGLPDLVTDGESGLLAALPGDAGAMAAAVDRAIGENGLAARLSLGAARATERNRWSAVEPLWRELLAEIT